MAKVNAHPIVKISGCLEKKAKLRIGSPWKKYWFVLEGRLLLYYRSKDEYETLSPCKGSINLCPPCNVKPALSAVCVFQIECRASTVTLRAESRQEQERWMQALLAAIAQSKSSPNRMSHFRYSLDDLPMSSAEDKKSRSSLARQNTLPHRISSSSDKETKTNIIERLQNIGAQTYGGSLNTITKFTNKDQPIEKNTNVLQSENHDNSEDLSKRIIESNTDDNQDQSKHNEAQCLKFPQKTSSCERTPNLYIENEQQYSIIQEENSIDLRLDEQASKLEDTEKIKSVIIENDQYIRNSFGKNNINNNENKKSFMLENDQYDIPVEEKEVPKEEVEASFIRNKEIQRIEHLYERISSDSTVSECNKIGKVKHNNLYERISSSSGNSDNVQYSTVQKDGTKQKNKSKVRKSQENEYSIPIMDHNKNSLLFDNEQYVSTIDDKSNDSVYSDGLIYTPEYIEYAAIDKTKEIEDLYEDPDHIKKTQDKHTISALYQDVEPVLPPRPDSKKLDSPEETSSQTSSNEENKKSKHSKFKLLAHFMKSDKKSETTNEAKTKPKRRSTSFLRRVWRRKAKSLDSEDDITYETVDYEIIEKRVAKNKNDIEMLQELQTILETRKNMLQEKLHNNSEKKEESSKQSNENKTQAIAENTEPLETRSDKAVEEERPSLPPRQSSQSLSPYHDVPQNNQAVIKVIDNEISANSSMKNNDKTSSNANKLSKSIQTIDDILKDLDEEKDIQESRQKVKQLIEKFNDFQNDEEVILRRKSKFDICKSHSDTKVLQTLKHDHSRIGSDELTVLLEELSKVTCAPVMSPGVTSSLVNPVLTDEEWLQLIPIRRRRLSDPDYDVPRPHRSLQLHGTTKQVQDNPILATRFFGPILPPSSTDDNILPIDQPLLLSMDPDSLEVEHLPTPIVHNQHYDYSVTDKDYSVGSYTSHAYLNEDKIIYAHPKILSPKAKEQKDNIYSNLNFDNKNLQDDQSDMNKNNLPITMKTEEMFIDSLEPLAEISTAF